MSNQYLSFDVTKQSAPQQLVTGRQGDSQLKFVTMLFWDGDKNVPYDLTGKQVAFEALKPDNTHVVDYEGITILDAPAGLVRYSFNEQVFSVAGTMQQAFFKITHTDSDNNVITDSTLEIAINILENRVEFGINSKNYLSEYDDLIAKVKKKFDDYAETVEQNINDVAKVHQELQDLMSQVDKIQLLLTRKVAVESSPTIEMKQAGDWDNNDTTTLSGEVIISPKKDNGLVVQSDGLFVTNGETGVPALKSLIETDNERAPQSIEFVLSPHIVRNAVMQHIHYDTTLGNWFITQSDSRNPEGFTLSRVNAGGELISNMYFKTCGHGSGVFLKPNAHDLPTVYFQTGADYRSVKYADNTTILPENAPVSFTPPVGAGNGMADFNEKYFVNNDNQGPRRNISIYEQQFIDGQFKFGEILAQVDITDQINADTNALQGIALASRREITGEDTENVYIMVLAGTATIKIDILLYEFDPAIKTIEFVKEIDKLENVVIPTFDKTGVNWNFFEAEGINVIRTSDGMNNSVGVVYGITANVLGKRKQYIYGLMNAKMSAMLSSARASISDVKSALFTYDTETKLSAYTNPGEYELPASLAMRYEDFPSHWRFINSQSDWILNVSANNQNGDIVQTLIRRGVASPMEIYIRTINFSANDFGAGYVPTGIAPWNVVKTDTQQAKTMTSTNAVKFKKLSDFSAPGMSYYVTYTAINNIQDLEGLSEFLMQRGFKISCESAGGAADKIWQKVEVFVEGKYKMASRVLNVSREQYGPQMVVDTSTMPKWSVVEGTVM